MYTQLKIIFLIALLINISTQCEIVDAMVHEGHNHDDHHNHQFNYQVQGQNWEGVCKTGSHQSPINLESSNATCDDKVGMNYTFNNTIQRIIIQKGQCLKSYGSFGELISTDVNGIKLEYDAVEFHIHAPSEHTMDGRYYEAEIHFVHKLKPKYENLTSQKFAVIAVFLEQIYEENQKTSFLDEWNIKKINQEFEFNLKQALDNAGISFNSPYIAYQGSLTTPPCTEAVNWHILQQPGYIKHQTQGMVLNSYFKNNQTFAQLNGNNRFVHPINDIILKQGNKQCNQFLSQPFPWQVISAITIFVIFVSRIIFRNCSK